jgi:hydroxymethylpyrimidine/phosphomethylpyrimidine kinase
MKEFSEKEKKAIYQVNQIYEFFAKSKKSVELIPEVRTNISCALPDAQNKEEVAAIEGRITVIKNHPYACGEIKFGVSDHTARLILTTKKYDNSICCVMNLKYRPNYIKNIKENTDLYLVEIERAKQPEEIKEKEHSTMQWLIKESINKRGQIPDIIWDTGAIGKEPMMRLFAKGAQDMIGKLRKILDAI